MVGPAGDPSPLRVHTTLRLVLSSGYKDAFKTVQDSVSGGEGREEAVKLIKENTNMLNNKMYSMLGGLPALSMPAWM